MSKFDWILMLSLYAILGYTTVYWNERFLDMRSQHLAARTELSLVIIENRELKRQTVHCIRRPSVQFGGQL